VLPRSSWTTRVSELPGEPVRLDVMTAVQGG
jgi:sulfur carrier protein